MLSVRASVSVTMTDLIDDDLRWIIDKTERDWDNYGIDSYRGAYIDMVKLRNDIQKNGYLRRRIVDPRIQVFCDLVSYWEKIVDVDWDIRNIDSSKAMVDDVAVKVYEAELLY